MIVIHIGAKKAGSSTIQSFLSHNEGVLRQLSVEYCPTGSKTHRNVAYELQRRRRDKFDPAYGTLRALADQWSTGNSRTLVLSSERFEECKSREIKRLKKIFAARRPEEQFKIVLIIRDLVDLIPSIFNQKTRNAFQSERFDEFFEKMMLHPRIDFFLTAERWANFFGWSAMHVRNLEPRNLVNSSLLDEFSAVLELNQKDTDLVKTNSRNESADWKSLAAVQALFEGRHGLPDSHPLLAEARPTKGNRSLGKAAMSVAARQGWNMDKGRYLTLEQARRCVSKFQSVVERLNSQTNEQIPPPIGLDERKFVAREFEPDVKYIAASDLRSFYDELWLEIKSEKRQKKRNAKIQH